MMPSSGRSDRSPAPADRLREIMRERGLTRAQVARLLDVSLDTVHSWLRPPGNRAHRAMKAREIRGLERMLQGATTPGDTG